MTDMEDQQGMFPHSSSSSLCPLPIDEELWLMAEERAEEILYTIQPNQVSEQRRNEIIDYVQRLIKGYYGTEVFSFGSVPLKTYLPDGDIDLTALTHQDGEEDFARQVCGILESVEHSDFQVKDIQYINAQVKVVKCTVKSIAVDISFNQMAGLCTLCFLEQVDQFVGKNHLFKRSIILIKAWCYYESRILGAHHGLLSTYALETLVLYIINHFSVSLRGPLEVLYRFLEYYSTFDWDNYCVSVNGPVALSSLPEIVVTPECLGTELLFSNEFLRSCRDIFEVPVTVSEKAVHEFPIKHLNVLDPLKDNNNLGRSVSKGNFHRIRCALSYGAQKLAQILTLPGETMGGALEKFFLNTLDRNGKGQRPDVQVPIPAFGTGRSEASDLSGDYENYYGCLKYGHWYHNCVMPISAYPNSPSSHSQEQNKVSSDLAHTSQYGWNAFYHRGTDVYGFRQILFHPNFPQIPCAAFNFEKRKSRGTGTYIPDANYHSYVGIHARETRTRDWDSLPHGLEVKSSQERDHVKICSKMDMICNGGSFKASSEEFPLLPCIHKPMCSESQEPVQLTFKSQVAKDSSHSNWNIEFGTLGQPEPSVPMDLHLSMKNEHVKPSLLRTSETRLCVPFLEIQKNKQKCENDREINDNFKYIKPC